MCPENVVLCIFILTAVVPYSIVSFYYLFFLWGVVHVDTGKSSSSLERSVVVLLGVVVSHVIGCRFPCLKMHVYRIS